MSIHNKSKKYTLINTRRVVDRNGNKVVIRSLIDNNVKRRTNELILRVLILITNWILIITGVTTSTIILLYTG